ncbi:MAG: hypothetical protein A2W28_08720 [Gammaproteobacteria bacterium RBG_16_51_14]|nr:MAG: hypothetical protein A2W28_08720 [Gammaproteobacteria bacterium RBG_16_51_14]
MLVMSSAWALDEDSAGVAVESAEEADTVTPESPASPLPEEIDTLPDADKTDDIPGELPPAGETGSHAQTLNQKDVVLVLDNSGSMKKNDPLFLAKQAVTQFISGLDESTRVAVIIFDQDVRLAVPLTDISLATRETILGSLSQINYKGLYTDSPAGIERAIYELKINGRKEAQKLILFMTDGIVDTGDVNRDLEKAKWLKADLAADAADSSIRIFGVAYTNQADFELIQSLAQQTDGEYYRAMQAEDLQNVFDRIHTAIDTPPEPEPGPEQAAPPVVPPPVPEPVQVQPVAPPPPVIIEVPVQPSTALGKEERVRSIIILVAAGILIIALLAILILLLRRTRGLKTGEDEYIQEAYLNDINGYTDKQTHRLGKKPAMMGRVAGKDTDHLDYIVIPESTIGRRHAMIEYKDYAFWIVDQGSINGTFINNQPVTTEVRLKHGDRIRLHKCEFEFVMPEMEDSGKTMISSTVFAAPAEDRSEEVTAIRGGYHDTMDKKEPEIPDSAFDLDIDITGASGEVSVPTIGRDEEDTIIPEMQSRDEDISMDLDISTDASEDIDTNDETIMLDEKDEDTDNPEKHFDDDDATLRPDND